MQIMTWLSSPILGQCTNSARSTSFQPTSGILARERPSAKIVSRWNDVPVDDGDEATVESGAIPGSSNDFSAVRLCIT